MSAIIIFLGILLFFACILIYAVFFDEENKVINLLKTSNETKKQDNTTPPKTQTTETPIRSEQEENYEKGLIFEQYILTLFSNFVIEDVTSDYYNKAKGIIVESSMNPDFRIRHEPTKTVFAVECKFRKTTYWDNAKRQNFLKWSYPEQLNRYREYQRKNNIPVCVVIGLGENPSKPTDIFFMPLNSLHSPIITQTKLFQFKRNPRSSFTWSEVQERLEK